MRRALILIASVLVLTGIAVAIFAFPVRYRCVGDDFTFTTSRSFAEEQCAQGDGPPGVERDLRLPPRLAVFASVLFLATILLRLGSKDADPINARSGPP